jgi:hypothetical protein
MLFGNSMWWVGSGQFPTRDVGLPSTIDLGNPGRFKFLIYFYTTGYLGFVDYVVP